MADVNLEKAAKELGLEVIHRTGGSGIGYVEISGPIGEVLRAWDAAGYDREQTHDGEMARSWNFYLNGQYVGLCDELKAKKFGHSFTSCI
jgi:hypothetical protein